jgi:hypothetical protein
MEIRLNRHSRLNLVDPKTVPNVYNTEVGTRFNGDMDMLSPFMINTAIPQWDSS